MKKIDIYTIKKIILAGIIGVFLYFLFTLLQFIINVSFSGFKKAEIEKSQYANVFNESVFNEMQSLHNYRADDNSISVFNYKDYKVLVLELGELSHIVMPQILVSAERVKRKKARLYSTITIPKYPNITVSVKDDITTDRYLYLNLDPGSKIEYEEHSDAYKYFNLKGAGISLVNERGYYDVVLASPRPDLYVNLLLLKKSNKFYCIMLYPGNKEVNVTANNLLITLIKK